MSPSYHSQAVNTSTGTTVEIVPREGVCDNLEHSLKTTRNPCTATGMISLTEASTTPADRPLGANCGQRDVRVTAERDT